MSNVTSMIAVWLDSATDEQIEQKIEEYSELQCVSHRDNEVRLNIKILCQNELARRNLVSKLNDAIK